MAECICSKEEIGFRYDVFRRNTNKGDFLMYLHCRANLMFEMLDCIWPENGIHGNRESNIRERREILESWLGDLKYLGIALKKNGANDSLIGMIAIKKDPGEPFRLECLWVDALNRHEGLQVLVKTIVLFRDENPDENLEFVSPILAGDRIALAQELGFEKCTMMLRLIL